MSLRVNFGLTNMQTAEIAMRLTKIQMAKVIVQALYNMPRLPADDHFAVVRMAKAKADWLAPRHKQACDILHAKAIAA